MIEKILNRQEFLDRPPVLLDIGASGELNQKWHTIAKYSTCIACDADSREFGYVSDCKDYKRLFVVNKICREDDTGDDNFYLTKSPYCSSTLKPDTTKLANWEFASLFEIVSCKKLPSVQMSKLLQEVGVDYIDYFKTDSQGTDLRLFTAITEGIRKRVLFAEFEPGIMDAYIGEDKLAAVLNHMGAAGFWMTDLNLFSVKRINPELFTAKEKGLLRYVMSSSPGWAEIAFLNNLDNSCFSIREYLLEWVFAYMGEQYGFALEIISKGKAKFSDPIWDELHEYTMRNIKSGFRYLFLKRASYYLHRLIDKCLKTDYLKRF